MDHLARCVYKNHHKTRFRNSRSLFTESTRRKTFSLISHHKWDWILFSLNMILVQLLHLKHLVTVFLFIRDTCLIQIFSVLATPYLCGGILTNSSGEIKSPGYPDSYTHNLNCQWTISIVPGSKIKLSVEDFDVEPSPECRSDFVILLNTDNTLIGW